MNENPHSPNTPGPLTDFMEEMDQRVEAAQRRQRARNLLLQQPVHTAPPALPSVFTDEDRPVPQTGDNIQFMTEPMAVTRLDTSGQEKMENQAEIDRLRQQMDVEGADSEYVSLLDQALNQRLVKAVSYNR